MIIAPFFKTSFVIAVGIATMLNCALLASGKKAGEGDPASREAGDTIARQYSWGTSYWLYKDEDSRKESVKDEGIDPIARQYSWGTSYWLYKDEADGTVSDDTAAAHQAS